jgi:hypothetical protein
LRAHTAASLSGTASMTTWTSLLTSATQTPHRSARIAASSMFRNSMAQPTQFRPRTSSMIAVGSKTRPSKGARRLTWGSRQWKSKLAAGSSTRKTVLVSARLSDSRRRRRGDHRQPAGVLSDMLLARRPRSPYLAHGARYRFRICAFTCKDSGGDTGIELAQSDLLWWVVTVSADDVASA